MKNIFPGQNNSWPLAYSCGPAKSEETSDIGVTCLQGHFVQDESIYGPKATAVAAVRSAASRPLQHPRGLSQDEAVAGDAPMLRSKSEAGAL